MAHGNAMLKPIKRWLQREPPPQCVMLALVCAGMSESVVQAWPRAEWEAALVDDLATDILATSDDHATGIGRECRYLLKWLNDEGATVISTTWRAGEGLNLNLDGSVESQLSQLQRHLEAKEKLQTQAHASLLDAYQELLSRQSERIAHLEAIRDAYEGEKLLAASTSNGSSMDKVVEQLGPLLVKQLTEGKAKKAPEAS